MGGLDKFLLKMGLVREERIWKELRKLQAEANYELFNRDKGKNEYYVGAIHYIQRAMHKLTK